MDQAHRRPSPRTAIGSDRGRFQSLLSWIKLTDRSGVGLRHAQFRVGCFNPCCRGSSSPTTLVRVLVERSSCASMFQSLLSWIKLTDVASLRGERQYGAFTEVSILVVVDQAHRRYGLSDCDRCLTTDRVSILVVVDQAHRLGLRLPRSGVCHRPEVSILVVVDQAHRLAGLGRRSRRSMGHSFNPCCCGSSSPTSRDGLRSETVGANGMFQSLLLWIKLTDPPDSVDVLASSSGVFQSLLLWIKLTDTAFARTRPAGPRTLAFQSLLLWIKLTDASTRNAAPATAC